VNIEESEYDLLQISQAKKRGGHDQPLGTFFANSFERGELGGLRAVKGKARKKN